MGVHVVRRMAWPIFLLGGLLLLGAGNELLYGITVPAAALVLVLIVPGPRPRLALSVDGLDLAVVAFLYAAIVAVFWLAFRVFTQQNTLGVVLAAVQFVLTL